MLKKFLKRAQNKFDDKVKKIRSDNGTEFKNIQVEEYFDQECIKHEFLPPPHTPQKIGWPKEIIGPSLSCQGQCLMNTKPPIAFGMKRSTWHVIPSTSSIFTAS
jgi:hypothetical protein